VSTAEAGRPLSATEARALFAELSTHPSLIVAVSGGPDSTALLWLAARWRKALKRGPKLVAITVDHGLRAQARQEALAVAKLARSLGVEHRILRWTGPKPKTGVQAAARSARYRLLARAARQAGASAVLTAHTLDDQAETVLMRLARGSGVGGLAAMSRIAPVPGEPDLVLVRPLLEVPKARLVATLRRARVPFAEDPSNLDPRFTRARFRSAMPVLAGEGLTAGRLALLARRIRRADAAIEAAVDAAAAALSPGTWPSEGAIVLPSRRWEALPAEVGLRLLGRAIASTGNEGPVELGKLEALCAEFAASSGNGHLRRTLAGALVTLSGDRLVVERAPARRRSAPKRP